jgi:hypothetical protein
MGLKFQLQPLIEADDTEGGSAGTSVWGLKSQEGTVGLWRAP